MPPEKAKLLPFQAGCPLRSDAFPSQVSSARISSGKGAASIAQLSCAGVAFDMGGGGVSRAAPSQIGCEVYKGLRTSRDLLF